VNALGVGGGAGVEMRRDAGGGRGGALGPLPLPLPQPAAALGPHVARSGREPKVGIFRNFAPPIHVACAYFVGLGGIQTTEPNVRLSLFLLCHSFLTI
jgi:hypothetical protein